LAQTLKNCTQIKIKALGHRKKLLSRLSRGARLDSFINYIICVVDGQILANLMRLYCLKRLQSAGWSTQLLGSAGSQPVSIVIYPVSQGAEHIV